MCQVSIATDATLSRRIRPRNYPITQGRIADRKALRVLRIRGMKKAILIGVLAAIPFSRAFAGDREELMARMGFSKEEIAGDAATHNTVTAKLDAIGGKSDPTAGESARRETNLINELRGLNIRRQQAENLAEEARHRAAVAKAEQLDAEANARKARSEPRTYSLSSYYEFLHEAKALRATAEALARKAEETRLAADAIIAKVQAAEAHLEMEQQARAEKNRLAQAEKERLARLPGH